MLRFLRGLVGTPSGSLGSLVQSPRSRFEASPGAQFDLEIDFPLWADQRWRDCQLWRVSAEPLFAKNPKEEHRVGFARKPEKALPFHEEAPPGAGNDPTEEGVGHVVEEHEGQRPGEFRS